MAGADVFVLFAFAPLSVMWSVWWSRQGKALPPKSVEDVEKREPSKYSVLMFHNLAYQLAPFDDWKPSTHRVKSELVGLFQRAANTYQIFLCYVALRSKFSEDFAEDAVDLVFSSIWQYDRDKSQAMKEDFSVMTGSLKALEGTGEPVDMVELQILFIGAFSFRRDVKERVDLLSLSCCLQHAGQAAERFFAEAVGFDSAHQ